jgi:hypothetical protein
MSFGVEQSQGTGGQTLGGLIADKAMKSRDDAKKERERQKKVEEKGGEVGDKDKKGLFRKALAHNFGGGLFSGKKSFGEHFNYKMPPKPESPKQESTPNTPAGGGGRGAGAGLAKILTGGFGSLVADTTSIQGGLTAITQLLNSQLQSGSFTANGISGITAILADQLEAQGEMIDLMGGNRPSGGASAAASGMFGVSGSVKTGGKTLTEAAINAAIEKGIGRFLMSRLSRFNPFQKKPNVPGGSSGPKGYYDDAAETSRRNAQRIAQEQKPRGFGQQLQDIGSGLKGKANQAVDFGKGVLGKAKGFGDNAIKGIVNNPISKRLGIAGARFGGRMIPVAGTGFSAVEAVDRAKKGDAVGAWLAGLGGGAGATATATSAAALTGAGAAVPAAAEVTSMAADIGLLGWDLVQAFNPASKMSSGGVMLGEAGKEAVVDLNSANARGNNAPEDPGMKASGASMLAVVDQFVKGMGPLGTPVSQALGPDVQNLSRKFGMSQALPNLRIGGGKFREDGNAKKERNKFLENLIAGSLQSLDAKKKDDKSTGTAQTQTKQEQQKQSNPSNPDTGSATETKTGADGKPMDTHDPKAYGAGRQSVVVGTSSGVGVSDVDTNRQTGQLEANHTEFDYNGSRYKVRINPNNGDYEVFKKGANFGFDQKIDVGGPQGPKKGQANEALLKIAHNEVRRFFLVNAPQKGMLLKYINQGDVDKNNKAKSNARVNGDQQRGGIVKQEFASGGMSVLDDLLRNTAGNVGGEIGAREGRNRTGNTPIMGDIGERIGRIKGRKKGTELYNNLTAPVRPEKGKSLFGVTNVKNEITVEQRLDDVEKVLAMMTGVLGILSPGIAESNQPNKQATASPPRSAPSAPPITATSQVADEMSNAAIINVIQSGGSSPTIQKSQDSVQNTAEYASDPSCGGLASVLCVSSPWGSM